MRFTKIKLGRMGVEIGYEGKSDSGGWDKTTMIISDDATPELKKTMDNLNSEMVELCELPKEEKARMTMQGVHFSYHGDDNQLAVVLSGNKKMKKSSGALILNSPIRLERISDKPNPKKDISDTLANKITELKTCAEEFLNGSRSQTKLKFDTE